MKEMSVQEFVAEFGIAKGARMLGMAHPPLYRAARDGSEITITVNDDGTASGKRITDFPVTKKKVAPG